MKYFAVAAIVAFPALAFAQGSILQAGPPTAQHAPMYTPNSGFGQAAVQDSGPAGGGNVGLGLSEVLQVNPSATPASGTGPLGTHDCHYSAPVTSAGYYYLCFDASGSSGGILAYGNAGTAPALPFQLSVNGVTTTLSALTFPPAGIANSNGANWASSYSTTGSGSVVALATGPTILGGTFTGTIAGNPIFSGLPTLAATGSTTNVSLPDRFAQRLNIRDGCGVTGAKGDGVTDDSAAIAACATLANTKAAAGARVVIYAPSGRYLVKASSIPTFTRGVGVIGDGRHETYFTLDPTWTGGQLFSWSDAWMASGSIYPQLQTGTGTLNVSADQAGPLIKDFTVSGNLAAGTQQDAFVFFDHEDFVLMENVDVFYINGQCIRTGKLLSDTSSYTRESQFRNITCFMTGPASGAAVDFANVGNSQGTGDIRVDDMNVFASGGVGLSMRAPAATNSVNHMLFSNLRIEQSYNDDLQIGAPSDAGITSGVYVSNSYLISPGYTNAGYYALNAGGGSVQSFGLYFKNVEIGPCWSAVACNGLKIDNVRVSSFNIGNIAVNGNPITYTANTGQYVDLNTEGYDQNYAFTTSGANLNAIKTSIYKYGDPSTVAANPSIAANYHDGTANFGSALGPGAVDLQMGRTAASQAATGFFSVLIGGSGNTASTTASAVVSGSSNSATGLYSFVGSGLLASDRGRYGGQTFSAGGFFAILGSSQIYTGVLRCTVLSPSNTCRATSDQAAAGAANCINLAPNVGAALDISLIAHDNTGNQQYTWRMHNAALLEGANAASMQYAAGATDTAVSIGTTTGASVAVSADTTNACLNVTFTAPSVGTDGWNVTVKVETVESK